MALSGLPMAPAVAADQQPVELRVGRNLVEMWGEPITRKVPKRRGFLGRLFGPKTSQVSGFNNIYFKRGQYIEDATLVSQSAARAHHGAAPPLSVCAPAVDCSPAPMCMPPPPPPHGSMLAGAAGPCFY